ncbi:hypothetical protein Thena_0076 [Thermodesulfobium narugense DSM 14796]|uniref:Uncharacterized protein n=1 Tax=Thermodesulfobium narugense DSM 14796 TaxID=747365 RepID=M1E5H5_9BACT|nr:hypothetical protein [Thermodesulfobium narugense]AEE13728.1 hypothetical protein Thena_0076 [Thermodesulfobium narugense DSM 14796]
MFEDNKGNKDLSSLRTGQFEKNIDESLKSVVEDIDTNEPVMVLRYTFFRTLSLFLLFLLAFLLSVLMALIGIFDVHLKSGFQRFMFATVGPLATFYALWVMIDLVNTKQIEVYRDRVVKRVKIQFLTQKDKAVYYRRAKYAMNWMGMLITEAKGILLDIMYLIGFLGYNKGFIVYTSRFKSKDEARFIKFLAQISGRNEGTFCRPVGYCDLFLQKFIKE